MTYRPKFRVGDKLVPKSVKNPESTEYYEITGIGYTTTNFNNSKSWEYRLPCIVGGIVQSADWTKCSDIDKIMKRLEVSHE